MTPGAYAAPRSLDEAVALLSKNTDALVLAGGHSLLVEPNRSRLGGSLLVDLRLIPGLAGISRDGGGARIGAMTTLSAIAEDETLRKSYPTLAEAAAMTGDAQLRNRATIGGSLVNTDPDNDFPAIALILDATCHIVGSKGERTVTADELFAGKSRVLGAGEVMTAVTLPTAPARSATAYAAVRNPATLTPICGVAASVTLGRDGTVTASRIALAGAGERPMRVQAAEAALNGKKPEAATLAGVGEAAASATPMRADLFAAADYRKHLTRVLTERAVREALQRI